MEKQDLDAQLALADKDYQEQKKAIIIRYCKANNPYNIGDIFTDHIGSIRIEKIGYSKVFGRVDYCCEYEGVVLKKDGTETKNRVMRTAWQSNEVNA